MTDFIEKLAKHVEEGDTLYLGPPIQGSTRHGDGLLGVVSFLWREAYLDGTIKYMWFTVDILGFEFPVKPDDTIYVLKVEKSLPTVTRELPSATREIQRLVLEIED